MPSYPHIERYRADLQRFLDFGGSDNEQSIRRAFAVCLDSYCRDHREKLALVDELDAGPGPGSRNRPDGTVKDSLRMARGYWEAKDSHDDLDAEIQAKFNRGYPRDNILFEDSQTAVLFQNGAEAMRVDMARPVDLHRLIRRFLDYELPQIEEFRQARQQFKADLPAVLESLREAVADAEAHNPDYQDAAALFLSLCRQTISPDVSDADVREMLLQHILTRDIFLRVFADDQFHRENNVARQLDALEQTFFTGSVRHQARDRLTTYYGAIGRAADEIADYAEKQQFLKAVYEDFYQAYNPAAADRLGVVYTPNEVVDFIIRGTDHLLQKHFGRTLADDNVQILDPATGTGTFITGLINHLPPDRLEYKYRHEIHANEVAILPYYIANLNIEYTYKERTGRYLEFPNLCFVDTLDNMDWQGASGGAVTRQGAFNLGGVSEENWIRVQEQNEKSISVIIGNPPYNAAQTDFNQFNPNREYSVIDQRIRESYSRASSAQNRNQQYDMYKRFIRWASDRLADDGIIGFVSNSAFLDANQDDGFRQVIANEFNELWAIDLKGNARTSGERRKQEGGNIFDDKIRVGVAIYFLVRGKHMSGFKVYYNAVVDYAGSHEKVEYIKDKSLAECDFAEHVPNDRGHWINQSSSDFRNLISLRDPETLRADASDAEQSVFKWYSNGVATQRDEWVVDYERETLGSKIRYFANIYEAKRRLLAGSTFDHYELGAEIKWDADLIKHLQRDTPLRYSSESIVRSLYRPFTIRYLYFQREVNGRQYQMPRIFPGGKPQQNLMICFVPPGCRPDFSALATDHVTFKALFIDGAQCLPLYRYTPDGERVSNITQWGLRHINDHYRKEWGAHFDDRYPDGITAEDIFAYTYAVLHDPVYRHEYRVDLLREFPRLPFYHDFDTWAKMGRELLDLHLGFETADPYPLERVEKSPSPTSGEGRGEGRTPRAILRADKERGVITLDDQTTLTGVPADAWRYQLGSRSALEWVLDQYRERKPRDPTIRERFNTYRFADHKERVIDLLQRVCTVSVKTMDIVDDMAYWEDGHLIVFGDRDKHEWEAMALSEWFGEPGGPDDDPEYQAWLASLPDIRDHEK